MSRSVSQSVFVIGVGGAMLAVACLEWTQNRCTHPRVLLELAVALLFAWMLRAQSSSKPEGRCEPPPPPELLVSAQDGASEVVRKMKEHGDRTDYQVRACDPRPTIYRAPLSALPRLAMVGARRHGAPITLAAARQEQAREGGDCDCRTCVEERRPSRFSPPPEVLAGARSG